MHTHYDSLVLQPRNFSTSNDLQYTVLLITQNLLSASSSFKHMINTWCTWLKNRGWKLKSVQKVTNQRSMAEIKDDTQVSLQNKCWSILTICILTVGVVKSSVSLSIASDFKF